MKIAIIGSFPPPVTGEADANDQLAVALSARHEITRFNTSILKSGSTSPGRWSWTKAVRGLRAIPSPNMLRPHDVVYISLPQSPFGLVRSIPILAMCRRFQQPMVLHIHGSALPDALAQVRLQTLRRYLVKAISSAFSIICLSKILRAEIQEALPSARTAVVPNYYDPVIDAVTPPVRATGPLRILLLSNLIPEKGILETIRATDCLINEGCDIELRLAGAMSEPVQRELAKSPALKAGKIHYAGIVSGEDKVDIFRWGHVFVLPTYYRVEGVPISLIEAMAAGLYVITTRRGGIGDLVVDGVNGTIVPERSVPELATALRKVMANPDAVHKVRMVNYDHARSMYTTQRFVHRIEGILEQATAPVRQD